MSVWKFLLVLYMMITLCTCMTVITAPEDNAEFEQGEEVNFSGRVMFMGIPYSSATNALEWRSSIDGDLGQGGSVSVPNEQTPVLSVGTHTISAISQAGYNKHITLKITYPPNRWIKVTEGEFPGRCKHTTLVFMDNLWLLGGAGGLITDFCCDYETEQDVRQSTDGINWIFEGNQPSTYTYGQGVAVWNGMLYAYGAVSYTHLRAHET